MIRNTLKILALSAFAALPVAALAGDPVVEFATGDPRMEKAVQAARATLPTFLSKVIGADGRGAGNATLKVAIPREDGVAGNENIWVGSLQRQGDGFRGQLENEPNYLKGLRLGSPVRFGEDQITDWGLLDGASGKLFGHYTTRVVIANIDAQTRARIEAILAKPPLPAGW